MIRQFVQRIVASKLRCNEAYRLRGREPIFHAASQTEKLAFELSQFQVQTEEDFKKFVDMIYRFIIESSGNGKRLPADFIVDLMKSNLKELRNHFFHIREYGKPTEVRRKYRKIGTIYQNLIEETVPKEEDWAKLQIALLEQIANGLQRVLELSSIKGTTGIYAPVYRHYEDNRVFIFGEKNVASRSASKKSYLTPLAAIPIFMPYFHSNVSPPRLGRTKSAAYITSRPPWYGEIDEFTSFAEGIEKRWRENNHFLNTYGPIHWTISEEDSFTYGCGADNLGAELHKHRRAAVGGIMQGCFGEHYGRTCFLVLYAYRKGDRILDIGVDLYLSSVPTEFHWVQELLNAREHFSVLKEDVRIEHFSVEPVRFLRWVPKTRRKAKFKILGALRREGFGLSKEDRERDIFRGIIVKTTSLSQLDYHQVDSWNMELLSTSVECPIFVLDEFVMTMRDLVRPDSVPKSAMTAEIRLPEVSMFALDAYGAVIHGIAIYPSWGFPDLTSWNA